MSFNVRLSTFAGAMRSLWLLASLATLYILKCDALVLRSGRGCLPGQFPGPGSPPCSKDYHGSGNIEATPAPGNFPLPTPNPAGILVPGCSCPVPMPGMVDHKEVDLGPAKNLSVRPIRDAEVEVVTVDVRVANRVRCDNRSVAEDVAKLLKIPLKRIAVTPWSWTLPDPPQSNYLAFIQQNHERCDCEGESGNEQGFRKSSSTSETGVLVAPSTTVMTVAQFQALQGINVMCADGLKLTPIDPGACPTNRNLPKCSHVGPGEMCDGDGECGTNKALDNCGTYDIYKKESNFIAGPSCMVSVGTLRCSDSIRLTPVNKSECPSNGNITKCSKAAPGELCDGDGECGTNPELNNCGNFDVYRKCGGTPTAAAPPAVLSHLMLCADGLEVRAIKPFECPLNPNLRRCDDVLGGELCEGDGECGTDPRLNNCGKHDVYRKCNATALAAPATTTTTTALPQLAPPIVALPRVCKSSVGNIKCNDGLKLTPIRPEECPLPANLSRCDQVLGGQMCAGRGECGTDPDMNNCGGYDIYRKEAMLPFGVPEESAAMHLLDGEVCAVPSCGAPKCMDGFKIKAVKSGECPAKGTLPPKCNLVPGGELCDGAGECGSNAILNNCGMFDIYRKCKCRELYIKVTLRTHDGRFAAVDADEPGNWSVVVKSDEAGPLEQFDVQYYTESNAGPFKGHLLAPGKHTVVTLSSYKRHMIVDDKKRAIAFTIPGSPTSGAAGAPPPPVTPPPGGEHDKVMKLLMTREGKSVLLKNEHDEYLVEKNGRLILSATEPKNIFVDVAPVREPLPPPPPPPPPSRVQMLTRDPCLVHLLREMTSKFRDKIASCMGVNKDRVIVDPPPVKGTVGLLQLQEQSETESYEVPVLGVRQCNLADLGELAQKLSLVSLGSSAEDKAPAAAPAPAPAPFGIGPAPADFPLFAVSNESNVTNATNSTNGTALPYADNRVHMVVKIHNLDYDILSASWPLVSAFTTVVKLAIGTTAHLPRAAIKLALFPGSVVIEAKIKPPPPTSTLAVTAFLNNTICDAIVTRLNTMVGLRDAMKGPLECNQLELHIEDPPYPSEELNRAWISFWSIVLPPPTKIAQDDAYRLLRQVNEPGTCLSKLLPVTLARIPGMQYRAIEADKSPNAAIKSAEEVRLPPPDDKSLGIKLPNPYDKKAEIEWNLKRMKAEAAAAKSLEEAKRQMEKEQSSKAIEQANTLEAMIKAAKTQFTTAARVHAEALQATNISASPDIVPFDVLNDAGCDGGAESPYPWRDQYPPPAYLTSSALLQDVQSPFSAKLCN